MNKKTPKITRGPIACPYPIKGDNGTALDCNNKGHCTCIYSQLLSPPPRFLTKKEIKLRISAINKEIKILNKEKRFFKEGLKEGMKLERFFDLSK